jgi:hypothetical protein
VVKPHLFLAATDILTKTPVGAVSNRTTGAGKLFSMR